MINKSLVFYIFTHINISNIISLIKNLSFIDLKKKNVPFVFYLNQNILYITVNSYKKQFSSNL